MTVKLTRRRAITVLAAAAGLPLLMRAGQAEARLFRWDGKALGADASIQLYHNDEGLARAAVEAGVAELARMEGIFSLYRADSALSALNRDGVLENAPAEFLEMLGHALTLASVSGGLYDPTIQPVWQLYFRHFTAAVIDPAGPSERDIRDALSLVDWRGVEVDPARARVSFARPGMGITLNSGAQGYITDRVTAVLRSYGFENMLVDMGEPRAVSTKPDGSAWRIGIANPADPSRSVTTLEVVDKCVATSGGYGTLFDDAGAFTHIIDSRTGRTVPADFGVSVVADTAGRADGLATAMLLAPVAERQALLAAAGGIIAVYVTSHGVATTVEA